MLAFRSLTVPPQASYDGHMNILQMVRQAAQTERSRFADKALAKALRRSPTAEFLHTKVGNEMQARWLLEAGWEMVDRSALLVWGTGGAALPGDSILLRIANPTLES